MGLNEGEAETELLALSFHSLLYLETTWEAGNNDSLLSAEIYIQQSCET